MYCKCFVEFVELKIYLKDFRSAAFVALCNAILCYCVQKASDKKNIAIFFLCCTLHNSESFLQVLLQKWKNCKMEIKCMARAYERIWRSSTLCIDKIIKAFYN